MKLYECVVKDRKKVGVGQGQVATEDRMMVVEREEEDGEEDVSQAAEMLIKELANMNSSGLVMNDNNYNDYTNQNESQGKRFVNEEGDSSSLPLTFTTPLRSLLSSYRLQQQVRRVSERARGCLNCSILYRQHKHLKVRV